MKRIALIVSMLVAMCSNALSYEATANFSQDKAELVSGWFFKGGAVKGGPYTKVTDCGKPNANADGTYDCLAMDWTANPAYGVVSNYTLNEYGAKVEGAISTEATLTVTVPPPGSLKLAVVVTTTAKINKQGKLVASTTTEKMKMTEGMRAGTVTKRDRKGELVTTTIIALQD